MKNENEPEPRGQLVSNESTGHVYASRIDVLALLGELVDRMREIERRLERILENERSSGPSGLPDKQADR